MRSRRTPALPLPPQPRQGVLPHLRQAPPPRALGESPGHAGAPSFAPFAKGGIHGCGPLGISNRLPRGKLNVSEYMCCVERAPSPAAFDFEAGQHKPPPLCCLGGDGSGRARLPIVPPQSPLFKGSGAPSFALFAKGEFHGCSPFGISRRRHSGPLPLSLNGAAQAGPLCFSCGRNAKHHLACGFGTGVIISILVSI